MPSNETPTVIEVKRRQGVAGSFALDVRVQYPNEEPSVVTFHGSVYGPPIVMAWTGIAGETQVYVSRDVLDRIGSELNEEWVRKFFA